MIDRVFLYNTSMKHFHTPPIFDTQKVWAGHTTCPVFLRPPCYEGNDKQQAESHKKDIEKHIWLPVKILNQEHTAEVTVIQVEDWEKVHEMDAMITQSQEIALFILASDCVPVFLYDPITSTIAAIHSGRRGTLQEITRNTIVKMQEVFQVEPRNIQAYIGPAISQKSYEVGEEEIQGFDTQYIKKSLNTGKYLLDIITPNYDQLINLWVLPEHITLSWECTYQNPDTFFSYRRWNHEKKQTQYGNNGFGIWLKT